MSVADIAVSSSNVTSVNVGTDVCDEKPMSYSEVSVGSNSKSVGNGMSWAVGSGVGTAMSGRGAVLNAGWFMADCCSGLTFMRARMYAVRNSDGNSSGRGCVSALSASSDLSGVVSVQAGWSISVGCMRDQSCFMILGTGGVNNGFLVRMINVVLAIYNGNAANISIPNTNPGNPRNWACIRCCQ